MDYLVPPKKHRRTSSVDSSVLLQIDEKLISSHKPQCVCPSTSRFLKKYCKSDCRRAFPDSCPTAHKWCHLTQVPANRTEIYYQLQQISIESDTYKQYLLQIEVDLTRTFPDLEYFTNGLGVGALRRVLRSFVKYHYQLGYVQGMNYIVCSLLWHASEVDAFWLFVVLMDEYKLRENYLFRFPGVTKHCEIAETLMERYLSKLLSHFYDYSLDVQLFATDWLLTLFTNLVPIESSHKLIGYFIKFGWIFIYKLLITILERLEDKLLATEDRLDMLRLIKPMELVNNQWMHFLLSLQKKRETLTWQKLIGVAVRKNINAKLVDNLLNSYKMQVFEADFN